MERKAILSPNGARIPAGQRQNFGSGDNRNRVGIKRKSENLSTQGPPSKVYFGNNYQLLRAHIVTYERVPILRKRDYSTYDSTEIKLNRPAIPEKLAKKNVDDDVEDMIKQFEKWEKDDSKENNGIKKKKVAGRRIWHIEAYIVQNVFENSAEAEPEITTQP